MKARQYSQNINQTIRYIAIAMVYLPLSPNPFHKYARSVIGLLRPCFGRSEFEHYASVKDNTAGVSSILLAF